jgi:hypothetical protein
MLLLGVLFVDDQLLQRINKAFDAAMNVPEEELPDGLAPDADRPPFNYSRKGGSK